MKKQPSSFSLNAVLLILMVPFAVYLGALWECWGNWPHLGVWDTLDETFVWLSVHLTRGRYMPYLIGYIASCLVLGFLWLNSADKRRKIYYSLILGMSFTFYDMSRAYAIWASPQKILKNSPDPIPASPESIARFWASW